MTAPRFNMGRRRLVGILAVCALTLLNIWMANQWLGPNTDGPRMRLLYVPSELELSVRLLKMGMGRLYKCFEWYVVKPFKEAERLQQVNTVRDRRLTDVLVVSVDDIHPLQHLEEAAAKAEKKRKSTTSPQLTPSTTNDPGKSAANPNYVDQAVKTNAEQVVKNNWQYENSAFGEKQFNGQVANAENRMGVENVNLENSMVAGNVNGENKMVAGNVNIENRMVDGNLNYASSIVGGNVNTGSNTASDNENNWTNNNVNVFNNNAGNIAVPYSAIDNGSFQYINSNTYDHQMSDWNRQNNSRQAVDAITWSNHLNSVDTIELLKIKNNLETLKNLLRKFKPESRRSVLDHLTRLDGIKTLQPSVEPVAATFGENDIKASDSDPNPLYTQGQTNPLEFYHQGYSKYGLPPPQMAAPEEPGQVDGQLLTRLLNETNIDRLNEIVNYNADGVRSLLSQILRHLQQRQQQLQHLQYNQKAGFIRSGPSESGAIRSGPSESGAIRPGQSESGLIRSGPSESGAKATFVSSPDVSFDYNKNAIKEMIRNIAMDSGVDTSLDTENVVRSFLRDLQSGHL